MGISSVLSEKGLMRTVINDTSSIANKYLKGIQCWKRRTAHLTVGAGEIVVALRMRHKPRGWSGVGREVGVEKHSWWQLSGSVRLGSPWRPRYGDGTTDDCADRFSYPGSVIAGSWRCSSPTKAEVLPGVGKGWKRVASHHGYGGGGTNHERQATS